REGFGPVVQDQEDLVVARFGGHHDETAVLDDHVRGRGGDPRPAGGEDHEGGEDEGAGAQGGVGRQADAFGAVAHRILLWGQRPGLSWTSRVRSRKPTPSRDLFAWFQRTAIISWLTVSRM